MSARSGLVLPSAARGAIVIATGRRPVANDLGIPPSGVRLLVTHVVAICTLSLVGAIFQARNLMSRYGVSWLLDNASRLFRTEDATLSRGLRHVLQSSMVGAVRRGRSL